MQSQTIRYAGFDGRMENLDSDISALLMPIVSDNWAKYFTWQGTGEIPTSEKQKLAEMTAKAKKKDIFYVSGILQTKLLNKEYRFGKNYETPGLV